MAEARVGVAGTDGQFARICWSPSAVAVTGEYAISLQVISIAMTASSVPSRITNLCTSEAVQDSHIATEIRISGLQS